MSQHVSSLGLFVRSSERVGGYQFSSVISILSEQPQHFFLLPVANFADMVDRFQSLKQTNGDDVAMSAFNST